MNLFELSSDRNTNLLPYDGATFYYGRIFREEETRHYFSKLLDEIAWQHDQLKIFGKSITTKRKVAWYAEEEFSYRYSGRTKVALPWTRTLMEIKARVESESHEQFNACLLNLYHSGDEGMAWHSDDEKEIEENSAIASISLGAERKFSFKHKQAREKVDVWLEDGSLLIMQDQTQSHWLHQLPPTKKSKEPRINLTFRQMKGQGYSNW